jgi:acetoin utilization deacetylase AcuC-like enzyme
MRVSYHPDYVVPLPEGHPFPMGKFPALHRILLGEGLIRSSDVVAPGEAAWADLRLVHSEAYLSSLATGLLDRAAERRMGVPWSPALIRRSRLSVQGSINAARMALQDGIAANLAGGTHHAFPDHGEGFCVLNDVSIAIRALLRDGEIARALVIDLDVHQGNGTAAIFEGDPRVFTFSMHGERNYPWHKMTSTRDVGLPDRMEDDAYLLTLETHLSGIIRAANPDLAFYLAGVDPMAGDRFGRLSLTRDGLRHRDRMVLEALRRASVPVALVMSGGYARTPDLTADLHATAHREAAQVFGARRTVFTSA